MAYRAWTQTYDKRRQAEIYWVQRKLWVSLLSSSNPHGRSSVANFRHKRSALVLWDPLVWRPRCEVGLGNRFAQRDNFWFFSHKVRHFFQGQSWQDFMQIRPLIDGAGGLNDKNWAQLRPDRRLRSNVRKPILLKFRLYCQNSTRMNPTTLDLKKGFLRKTLDIEERHWTNLRN